MGAASARPALCRLRENLTLTRTSSVEATVSSLSASVLGRCEWGMPEPRKARNQPDPQAAVRSTRREKGALSPQPLAACGCWRHLKRAPASRCSSYSCSNPAARPPGIGTAGPPAFARGVPHSKRTCPRHAERHPRFQETETGRTAKIPRSLPYHPLRPADCYAVAGAIWSSASDDQLGTDVAFQEPPPAPVGARKCCISEDSEVTESDHGGSHPRGNLT